MWEKVKMQMDQWKNQWVKRWKKKFSFIKQDMFGNVNLKRSRH